MSHNPRPNVTPAGGSDTANSYVAVVAGTHYAPSEGVEERHDLASGELELAALGGALLEDGRIVKVAREQDLQCSAQTASLKQIALSQYGSGYAWGDNLMIREVLSSQNNS